MLIDMIKCALFISAVAFLLLLAAEMAQPPKH